MLNFTSGMVSFVSAMLALFPDPAAGLTFENSRRATLGRTLSHAEKVLGCPPGDYRTSAKDRKEGIVDAGPGWIVAKWYSDSSEYSLHVDDTGRFAWQRLDAHWKRGRMAGSLGLAHQMALAEGVPVDWRLKRQWHRWFP
jgi:hypothetical protein